MFKQLEDYELIKQCIDGNNDAFEEIINRYKNLVFSVIWRMVNDTEETNDLAQEVFIKVYKNLDKYQPEYKFSTWLIRIATNHVIDYRRKKKYDTTNIDDMIYEPSTLDTPETDYLKREKLKAVSDAINSLDDMYRIPIVLYHQQELSYQEIADILNIPLSKVKNRIFRARKLLKEILINRKEANDGEM